MVGLSSSEGRSTWPLANFSLQGNVPTETMSQELPDWARGSPPEKSNSLVIKLLIVAEVI